MGVLAYLLALFVRLHGPTTTKGYHITTVVHKVHYRIPVPALPARIRCEEGRVGLARCSCLYHIGNEYRDTRARMRTIVDTLVDGQDREDSQAVK